MSNPQSQLITCPECKGKGCINTVQDHGRSERSDLCPTCRGFKTIGLVELEIWKVSKEGEFVK